MIEYLPQALSSLSAAVNIAGALVDLRDSEKLNSKVIELQQCIITAQSQVLSGQSEQSTTAARIKDLEQECMRLKDWSAERENYSCQQIEPGVFAHLPKDFVGDFTNAQKLCSNCFENTVKSRLQQSTSKVGRLINLVCPSGCPMLEFRDYLQ